MDSSKPDIRASRSLFAARLPKPRRTPGVQAGDRRGSRRGYAKGPDDQVPYAWWSASSIPATSGVYLVQVAATTEEIEAQMTAVRVSISSSVSGSSLWCWSASSALQLRYGLLAASTSSGRRVTSIRRGETEKIDGVFPSRHRPPGERTEPDDRRKPGCRRTRAHAGGQPRARAEDAAQRDRQRGGRSTRCAVLREGQRAGRPSCAISSPITSSARARRSRPARSAAPRTSTSVVQSGLVRTFEKIYRDRGLTFAELGAPTASAFLGESVRIWRK